MHSLYEVIGVPRNATQAEIEAACLKLGAKFRPDKNASDATSAQVFQEIENAYAVLSDPVARRAYDLKLTGEEIGPELSSPKTANGFLHFWRARSTFSKVVLILLSLSVLGNLIAPRPDKPAPVAISSTEPQPKKQSPAANQGVPVSETTLIEDGSFRIHLGLISRSQNVQDLADRDRVIHSGRAVLLIVAKVIERRSASPQNSANCKERFSETLLRATYLKRFDESFNEGPNTEDSIVRALRETVGCEI